MGVVARIAAGVLVISFLTFLAFFGRLPALRHTPIAWLHRFLFITIPNSLFSLDQRLTSGRLTSRLSAWGSYIMLGRHPGVLIFFFLLLAVGQFMYLPSAWPRFSFPTKVLSTAAIAAPYIFLYLASFSDPGFITPENHAKHMAAYPYDFSLFYPGQICRTCNFVKPPRSKHCAVCDRCVGRMDHHCIFVNNCVGTGNTHYFLLLLLSTGILTTYGSALGLDLVSMTIASHQPGFSVLPWHRGGLDWREYLVFLTLSLQEDVGLGSITLLMLMTSPLVWGLLSYHIYLIYSGTTTNESMKWSDWKLEMSDGYAFTRRMPLVRRRDPNYELEFTRWPVESVQVIVRTEDGKPPDNSSGPGEGEWQRVWKLADVENLYDLGFWDNLVDVFLPGWDFRREDADSEAEGNTTRPRRRRKGRRKPKATAGAAKLLSVSS